MSIQTIFKCQSGSSLFALFPITERTERPAIQVTSKMFGYEFDEGQLADEIRSLGYGQAGFMAIPEVDPQAFEGLYHWFLA